MQERRKIITWDLGDEKRTANHYLRQCLKYYNNMTKSQEHSGFREVPARGPVRSDFDRHSHAVAFRKP
jgi:hypothetical protein